MYIKGLDKFREKLPTLSGKRIAVLPIYTICMTVIALSVYVTFDSLPATLPASDLNEILISFFPLFGVIIMEAAGFLLVSQLWLWRDRLKAKYGATSFQRIFPFGLAGIIWVLTIAINQYIPYYSFAPDFWASSSLQVFATPLETYLGIAGPVIFYVKGALTLILFTIGFLMCVRALQVFGLDNMAVVYLYFPEESKIQENEIYSALRHPTYAGVLLICLGGSVLTFTFLSFAAYAIFLAGFYLHIHFVEEKELVQRFGDFYINYRMKVPAFFVSPRSTRTLLHFLFKKEMRKLT